MNLDCIGLVIERGRERVTIRGELTPEEKTFFEKELAQPAKLIRFPPWWDPRKGDFAITRVQSEPRFHHLVLINGDPEIGEGTKIGIFSEVYDKGGIVKIGRDCDIASFVAINCSDSHRRLHGLSDTLDLDTIILGDRVYVGSHTFIGKGVEIGHHSVIAAGAVIRGRKRIPPYSLVWGNPAKVKRGHYAKKT